MRTVTDSTFEEAVLKSETPVVVDFFTTTCPPCRMLAPLLEQLNDELEDVEIVKFDASEGNIPNIYQITSVPTLILFKDGEVVGHREGSAPKAVLEAWIEISLGQ